MTLANEKPELYMWTAGLLPRTSSAMAQRRLRRDGRAAELDREVGRQHSASTYAW